MVELKDLSIGYAKQETLTPLKGLGRYIAFGIVGSLALGIGLVLWAVALLRVLQEETGTTFNDHWSWAPYLITLATLALIIGVAIASIFSEKRRSKRRKKRDEAAHQAKRVRDEAREARRNIEDEDAKADERPGQFG